jgi:carbamoyl-phosphate synthase large subunit
MGIDSDFGRAFAKAQIQAGNSLPVEGTVLVSVRAEEHERLQGPIKTLVDQGFKIIATSGTARMLSSMGIEAEVVNKVHEGSPHTADRIEAGDVALVINTVGPDPQAVEDSRSLRRAALIQGVPYCTTLAAARASADAIVALRSESIGVRSLQEIHETGIVSAGS